MNTITNTRPQPWPGGTSGGNNKRETYDQKYVGVDEQPPVKKVRLKRGALNGLVNQPGDVMYEIFCHLDPLDLLNLSRTSKLFRTQLLSRSATSIWKASISNVPGLPECPDDISYPRYAELAFGKACHFCWRQHSGVTTCWSARVRTCKACVDEEFHRVSRDDRPYSGKLFGLLPTAPIHEYLQRPGSHTPDSLIVLKAVDSVLFEEFLELELSERDQWESDKIEEWKAIHAHADRCKTWASELQDFQRAEKKKVVEGRRELVLERVRALGWGEELALISDARRRPENLSIVRKACNSRTLTEQALSNLEEPLIRHMTQVQKLRLTNARRSTLPNRLRVLKAFHTTLTASVWTPGNCIYPNTAELFRIPAVRDLIDSVPNTSPFTQDNLAPIHGFSNLMDWWRQDMELKLIDLICKKPSNREAVNREYVFNLATSLFSCSKCSRFLRHPRVVMHACATLPFHPEDSDIDTMILTNTLGESFWNLNGCITVNVAHVALLIRLLIMANLTWATTTIQELNACDPIFECIPCNDERMGRATMTWARVLVHCLNPGEPHTRVPDFNPNLVILDEFEAQIIRARMREQAQRDLYNNSPQQRMVCLRCNEGEGDFVTVQKHVRTIHGIPHPTNKDMTFYSLDVDRTLPIYRHWPPRTS